jgi:hypothetical protein
LLMVCARAVTLIMAVAMDKVSTSKAFRWLIATLVKKGPCAATAPLS